MRRYQIRLQTEGIVSRIGMVGSMLFNSVRALLFGEIVLNIYTDGKKEEEPDE